MSSSAGGRLRRGRGAAAEWRPALPTGAAREAGHRQQSRTWPCVTRSTAPRSRGIRRSASSTIGRQAIGYRPRRAAQRGRRVPAPFSPLEVDREWPPRRRRGACRAALLRARLSGRRLRQDAQATPPSSAGCAASRATSTVRSLLAGRRSTDWMFGATWSAGQPGDTALYGEAAWFYTRGDGLDGGWLGSSRWVAKLVGGGSYRVDEGRGCGLDAEDPLLGLRRAPRARRDGAAPPTRRSAALRARRQPAAGQARVRVIASSDCSRDLDRLGGAGGPVGLGLAQPALDHLRPCGAAARRLLPLRRCSRAARPAQRMGRSANQRISAARVLRA